MRAKPWLRLVLILTVVWSGVASGAEREGRRRVFVEGPSRLIIEDAIAGANRRLQRDRCQSLLADFRDQTGSPIAARLLASARSATEHLEMLVFVDAGQSPQCRTNEQTVAFTEPGSRVVHVCAQRFARAFARRVAGGEILVIHELLHTLGLGENPPTSDEITAQVRKRC